MTYCVGMCVDEGLVFLSDTRTNAGVDHVSAARKMAVFEQPGERVLVLLAAGNLALTQARHAPARRARRPVAADALQRANMAEAARIVGDAVREVHKRDALSLAEFSVDFNCSFILGGQIGAQSAAAVHDLCGGQFRRIDAREPVFPDRRIEVRQADHRSRHHARPRRSTKPRSVRSSRWTRRCAPICRSGLPLDLLVYEKDSLRVTRFASLDNDSEYFQMIHRTWGERLRQIFGEIPNPAWTDPSNVPLRPREQASSVPRLVTAICRVPRRLRRRLRRAVRARRSSRRRGRPPGKPAAAQSAGHKVHGGAAVAGIAAAIQGRSLSRSFSAASQPVRRRCRGTRRRVSPDSLPRCRPQAPAPHPPSDKKPAIGRADGWFQILRSLNRRAAEVPRRQSALELVTDTDDHDFLVVRAAACSRTADRSLGIEVVTPSALLLRAACMLPCAESVQVGALRQRVVGTQADLVVVADVSPLAFVYV